MSITASTSSWSGAVRGRKAVTISGVLEDGTVTDVSDSVTWSTANPLVAKHVQSGSSHFIQAVGIGATQITYSLDGNSGAIDVSVVETNIFVQSDNGRVRKYTPLGVQIGSTLVTGQASSKGMLAFPGGILSMANAAPKFKQYDNDLVDAVSPIPFDATSITSPQQAILTSDLQKMIVGSFTGSKFFVYDFTSGVEETTIATGINAVGVVQLPDSTILLNVAPGNTVGKFSASDYSSIGSFASNTGTFFYDYCVHHERVLTISNTATKDLLSCDLDGNCTVVVGSLPSGGGVGALTASVDLNSTDCSFFVGFESGRVSHYSGDGTLLALDWKPTGGGQVYNVEFEFPADQ